VWWLKLALLKWATLSEKKLTIILVVITALLITGIWAVEYRDRGTSVVPASPAKASAKAVVKAKPAAKAKAKAKAKVRSNKRVSRSRAHGFTAPQTGSNRSIGRKMAAAHGWTGVQWDCLNNLWQKESGWSTRSSNSSGSAWGIPQALPGSKMKSAGSDWRTNPATQIKWGIKYIDNRYGTACKAWGHWQSHNWY
jgi:hypothetical protein